MINTPANICYNICMPKKVSKYYAFRSNPHKANMRIMLNSTMIGVLFFILTLILATGANKFDLIIIAQVVLAIPLLYVSILAYTKIAFWEETKMWDVYGWATTYAGNTLLLNAIGLIAYSINEHLAVAYFALLLLLMYSYSIINISYSKKTVRPKLWKFSFFLIICFLGGILPLILKML